MKKAEPRKPGTVLEKFDVTDKKGKVHRVVFRYPRMSDAGELMDYINSLVEERAYVGKQKMTKITEERKWLRDSLKAVKECKKVHICLDIDGKIVGSGEVRRKSLDANRHVGTIGIGIAKEYRGIKVGKGLMQAVCKEGKAVLGLKLIESSYYERNIASERLHKSLGFKKAGRIPGGCNYYGRYLDEIIVVKKL